MIPQHDLTLFERADRLVAALFSLAGLAPDTGEGSPFDLRNTTAHEYRHELDDFRRGRPVLLEDGSALSLADLCEEMENTITKWTATGRVAA